MKPINDANRASYHFLDLLIKHYELPLYHPAHHERVRRQLIDYAHKVGVLEMIAGYYKRFK